MRVCLYWKVKSIFLSQTSSILYKIKKNIVSKITGIQIHSENTVYIIRLTKWRIMVVSLISGASFQAHSWLPCHDMTPDNLLWQSERSSKLLTSSHQGIYVFEVLKLFCFPFYMKLRYAESLSYSRCNFSWDTNHNDRDPKKIFYSSNLNYALAWTRICKTFSSDAFKCIHTQT